MKLPVYRISLFACTCLVFASLALHAGDDSPFGNGRWIDLTHDFSEETPYWPTADGFTLTQDFHGHTTGGYFYASNTYRASEHGGTHMDAPIHFGEGRMTAEQVPLKNLIGTAAVIDVSAKALENSDYLVSVADLQDWEEAHGRLPEGAIVLLHTGFDRYWPDRKKYLGTDERGSEAVAKLHFPGLGPEAAEWLVNKRKISAVGIDTASIDYGQSKLFKSHRILAAKNTPIFENVANLGALPPAGSTVIALPMKIKGGSGGPLRIVAHVKE